MNKKLKKDISNLKLNLIISIPILFFLFFVLPIFHNIANSFSIKLHFCNHTLCIAYSIIWLIFGVYNFINFCKEKKEFDNQEKILKQKKKNYFKKWLIIFLIVLLIGILLMNIIVCDNYGNIKGFGLRWIGDGNGGMKNVDGFGDGERLVRSEGTENLIPMPHEGGGHLSDSDGGRVYDVYGYIIGDEDMEDVCLNDYILREFFVESSSAVFGEEIDCREFYDPTACCRDGRCVTGCFVDNVSCEEIGESYLSRGENYGWLIIEEGESCEFFANDDCAYGVEWFNEPLENCCLWKCKKKLCTDNDGDGYYVEEECGERDCDDDNSAINPGAVENCSDGIDNDCNDLIDCEDENCKFLEFCIDCILAEPPECEGWCKEGTCQLNIESKECECLY